MITLTGFHDMRPGEQVVAVVRRHWFILFRDIFALGVLFLLPFFVLPLVIGIATSGGALGFSAGVGVFFTSLWALIMWNLLFARWTDYYFDVWILTSQRIIDINQQGLFHRDIATLFDLNHIEDVKTVTYGIIGNLLGFGKLQVQTAAHRDEFEMDGIANPVQFERIIRETQQKHLKRMMEEGGGGHFGSKVI
jgi:hypothetical protein